MPITASAKKALRGSFRKKVFNDRRKSVMKEEVKNFGKLIGAKNKKEAESLLVETIKPEELQKLTESTTDLLVAYLNYDSESVQLKYDLRQYKNNFVSGFRSLVVKKLSSLPTCTSKQLQSLGSNQEQIPNCKPNGQTGESLYKQFGLDKEITQGLKTFPDEIVITNSSILVKPKGSLDIDPNNSPISGLAGARENIANISKIRTFAAAILAVMALLILLFRLPSWRSIFSWLGSALLIGGATVTLLALALRVTPFFTSRLGEILGFPQSISSLVTDVGSEIVVSITYQIFIISIPTLIIGIVLIAATFFGKRYPLIPLPSKINSL